MSNKLIQRFNSTLNHWRKFLGTKALCFATYITPLNFTNVMHVKTRTWLALKCHHQTFTNSQNGGAKKNTSNKSKSTNAIVRNRFKCTFFSELKPYSKSITMCLCLGPVTEKYVYLYHSGPWWRPYKLKLS